MYQLVTAGVRRLKDNTDIPFADGNLDYEEYKLWLADGNAPTPMVAFDWRRLVWDEFLVKRDVYIGRLSEVAGRYSRRGDAVVPLAADAIVDGLIALPQQPAFNNPLIDTADKLRASIVTAANQLLRAQLTDATTALGIKAALDQVFKA